jgi:hypothetical protein
MLAFSSKHREDVLLQVTLAGLHTSTSTQFDLWVMKPKS